MGRTMGDSLKIAFRKCFFRILLGSLVIKRRWGRRQPPQKKQMAEGHLHTLVGGPGGETPRGGVGVAGGGPQRR
jgi:hypothetical protein